MGMNKDRPNVLLLSIDTLRANRMSLFGYDRPTTPNLDRFAEGALVCPTAFSLGPFTQSAFVQLMTSSRPLSHGGYDSGAIGRPDTLFRHFRNAGYRTTALSTLHWVNRYFGYGDGLDEEHQLFIINSLAGVGIVTTRNTLRGFLDGTVPEQEMLDIVRPVIARTFDNLIDYCETRLQRESDLEADFPHSLLVRAEYDYRKIIAIVNRHRQKFEKGPAAYVRAHLDPVPKSDGWMAREWYHARRPGKLVAEALSRTAQALIRPFSPSLARCRRNRFRSYVDAGSIADKTIRILKSHDDGKPFFLWAHFMDPHHPYVSGHGPRWYRETPAYLSAVGHDPKTDPSLCFDAALLKTPEGQRAASDLYDAAVRWTDEQVGRILDALDDTGLAENTIVAVLGDHGEEFGDRGYVGHYFLPSENNIRVPMLFRAPSGPTGEIDGLVTLLDLGPTLAALAGIAPANGWEGAAVTDSAVGERDHVMMETFFGGNCVFDQRALYMGVRTRSHKYMWKEFRDPADTYSDDGHELYDLDSDPDERTNIYRPDHPVVTAYDPVIARRLSEIPEISTERIIRCFGDAGRKAVLKRKHA